MAAVFCASFRRRAMVWRSRDIFTRSSRAATGGGRGPRWQARHGERLRAWPDAAMTSPLVRRPSLPRAGNGSRGRPCFQSPSCAPPATAALRLCTGWHARPLRQPELPLRLGRDAAPAAPSSIAPRRAPTFTVLPAAADDRRQLARSGGRHFHRHLVGFKFDQRLVGLHRIAHLLEPLGDRRLGDRFAEGRNADFFRHLFLSLKLLLSPGLRRGTSCSSLRCLLISPVAVDAEAGRPDIAWPRIRCAR